MNKNDTLECYTCGKEISYNEKAVIRSEFIFCTQKCCDAFFRCEYCGEQLDTKYAISEEGIFRESLFFVMMPVWRRFTLKRMKRN